MPQVDVAQISGTARSVQQLLANNKYGLDFYQREYGWEETHVAELIDDLATRFFDEYDENHDRKQVASYDPYFLGPIVTAMRDGTRYLVDGQQRLTTLSLLLIHLRHLLGPGSDEATQLDTLVFSTYLGDKSFNIDVDEREKCMAALLEGSEFDPSGESESVRNLWHRFENISERFPEDLAQGRALPFFKDWLIHRVILVEILAPNQDMALEIFETMNDRGLRLSNTDMLKSFLLSKSRDPETIERLNDLWRRRVTELDDIEKNSDAEFVKAWLRGNYAETQRERKKAAAPGDFDTIGTAFHKWARDNTAKLGLQRPDDYRRFVEHEFMRLSSRYLQLLSATRALTPGFEHVFYNATSGFTLQLPVILAALTPDDDDDAFREKTRLVAGALDLFVARRMVNFRNFGYSTVIYTMFNLMKAIRNETPDEIARILGEWLDQETETFAGVPNFRLTQRNRSHIRYLLARISAWLDERTGSPSTFADYVDRERKHPYEVEHIWANHYDRHEDEFPTEQAFQDHRNLFGGLVLLPKDFNASYGDAVYSKKLEHYFAQNHLAKSLHPNAYEKNPSFVRLIEASGLPFRPHPSPFSKSDVTERQELYRQICEVVWDPEAIGLVGGYGGRSATTPQSKTHYGVSLTDLLTAGLLEPGAALFGSLGDQRFQVELTSDGQLRTDDNRDFSSPSGAADSLTGAINNGWEFWSADLPSGRTTLSELRSELMDNANDAQEGNDHLTPRAAGYLEFWTRYIERAKTVHPAWIGRQAGPYNNYSTTSPIRGSYAMGVFTTGEDLAHKLWIDTGDAQKNRRIYRILEEQKEVFENAYGRPLNWDAHEDRRACDITDARVGSISEVQEFDKYVDWLIDAGERLRTAIDSIEVPEDMKR